MKYNNILGFLRSLKDTKYLIRDIDDYRHRLLIAEDDQVASLTKNMIVAQRILDVKFNFDKYNALIDHCLLSGLWSVAFSFTNKTTDFEEYLYGDYTISKVSKLYAILKCNKKVDTKYPVFYICLDNSSKIEYGLYNSTIGVLEMVPIKYILDQLKFNMDYNVNLMVNIPSYDFIYTGNSPLDSEYLELVKNSSASMISKNIINSALVEYKKLYYGTVTDIGEGILSNGLAVDVLTDSFEEAKTTAMQLPGIIDNGVIVFEVMVAIDEISEPFPIVRDKEGNNYTMLKDINDNSRIKIIYQSTAKQRIATYDVAEMPVTKLEPRVNNKSKDELSFEQLTFW